MANCPNRKALNSSDRKCSDDEFETAATQSYSSATSRAGSPGAPFGKSGKAEMTAEQIDHMLTKEPKINDIAPHVAAAGTVVSSLHPALRIHTRQDAHKQLR